MPCNCIQFPHVLPDVMGRNFKKNRNFWENDQDEIILNIGGKTTSTGFNHRMLH